MYLICNTTINDVRNGFDEMRTRKVKYPIYQIGIKVYNKINKNRTKVLGVINSRNKRHTINIKTGVIHKNTCKRQGMNTISAHLIRPKKAGLPLCSVCMK